MRMLLKEVATCSLQSPTRPCREDTLLAHVSECEHRNGSEHELPEAGGAGVLAGGLEDQVELNHLQRHGDAPVNVPVDNWGCVHLDPVLAHVHVVDASHQSDKTTNVQRGLPVIVHGACLSEEEHCCRNHGDGDDPEGNCNTIMWLQEGIHWVVHRAGGGHRSTHVVKVLSI